MALGSGHTDTADLIVKAGAKPRVFYCPGLTAGVSDTEIFADRLPGSTGWWNFNANRRIVGYGFLVARMSSSRLGMTVDATMTNRMTAGGEFLLKLTVRNPANQELVVDAVPSANSGDGTTFSIASGNIFTGFHKPGHMNKSVPDGGNILFVDGHVSWRKYRGRETVCVAGRDYLVQMYKTPDGRTIFWY